MKRPGSKRGQSTVEYMLYLSVIVVAACALAYVFIGPLMGGYEELKDDTNRVFTNAMSSGSGDQRHH